MVVNVWHFMTFHFICCNTHTELNSPPHSSHYFEVSRCLHRKVHNILADRTDLRAEECSRAEGTEVCWAVETSRTRSSRWTQPHGCTEESWVARHTVIWRGSSCRIKRCTVLHGEPHQRISQEWMCTTFTTLVNRRNRCEPMVAFIRRIFCSFKYVHININCKWEKGYGTLGLEG